MKFLEIKLSNFFSFGPKEEILDLSQPGLYLILGENGVGKSVVIDAIVFALFGKVVKNVNLPEVTNDQTNENTKVELKFEINGDTYWICRYRKHVKYKNEVRMFKNDRTTDGLISLADSSDTQEKIDQLIRINYKAFINAVTMTQENVVGFLEADSNKRKEIIESILQLDLFVKYHYIAQEKRKALKRKLDIVETEAISLKKMIGGIETSMKQYADSCNNAKQENLAKIALLEKELKDLEHIDIDKEYALLKTAQDLSVKKDALHVSLEKINTQISGINTQKKSLTASKADYNKLILSAEKTIKRLNDNFSKEIAALKSFKDSIDEAEKNPEKCPTCENIINIDRLNAWVAAQRSEYQVRADKLILEKKHVEKEQTQLVEWNEKIVELDKQLAEIDSQSKNLYDQNKLLQSEYDEIEIPETMEEDDLKQLSDKKQKIHTQIEMLRNKKTVDKDYLNKQLEEYHKLKKELKDKEAETKSINKHILLYSFWEASFSSKRNSMKSWCINNIIGFFNAKIKYYIDRFFDGDVEVQLDNELSEKLSFKANNRSFGGFSGGQKRRLNLAILFALNSLVKANVSTKIKIMFLDEILSNFLDDKGISTVLELLEEMKDAGETVYIIDHRDNFKNYPSFQRIDVYKDKQDFSHITVG